MVGCSALRLLALAMALICLGNNLTRGRRILGAREETYLELILKSWQIQQRRRGENKWRGEATQWGYGGGVEEAKH